MKKYISGPCACNKVTSSLHCLSVRLCFQDTLVSVSHHLRHQSDAQKDLLTDGKQRFGQEK